MPWIWGNSYCNDKFTKAAFASDNCGGVEMAYIFTAIFQFFF